MRGSGRVWVLAALVCGCLPACGEIGGMSGGTSLVPENMVPDPAYQPKIGDRAVLFALENGRPIERLPLMKDLTAYDICVRSAQARDRERLRELEEQGWLLWVNPGTRVSVVAIQNRNHTGADTATEIRLVDEPQKKQTYWSPSRHVTRLIEKEPE